MRLVNLTPHPIVVFKDGNGIERIFEPSGKNVRCNVTTTPAFVVDDVQVVHSEFGELEGLPETEEGVYYIVSTAAAQKAAADGRTDVLSPDTGPTAIRRNGQVVAVRHFQTFVK